VVVAAVIGFREGALAVDGASELAAQITSVSFRRPRALRSFTKAAED